MHSTLEIKARGYHLDAFGVVNHGRIIELLEEARWAYFDERPQTAAALLKAGVGHSVVNLNVDYFKPVRLGQTMRLETSVHQVSGKSITMLQEISVDDSGEPAVRGLVTNVFFEIKGGRVVAADDPVFEAWPEVWEMRG